MFGCLFNIKHKPEHVPRRLASKRSNEQRKKEKTIEHATEKEKKPNKSALPTRLIDNVEVLLHALVPTAGNEPRARERGH